MTTSLMLHCGAKTVSREELTMIKTPDPTKTHFPLAHADFLMEVETQLAAANFRVQTEQHSLTKLGERYFGLLNLENTRDPDYAFVVGLRNSHDKTFGAAVAGGTRVFVCDNLSFSGEARLDRKHTRFVRRDLRHMTARLVGQLGALFNHSANRIDRYRAVDVTNADADHLIMSAVRAQAITSRDIMPIWEEWDHPTHEEFRARTIWSLFNACTARGEKTASSRAVRRGEALHGLLDGFCGLGAGPVIDV